LIPALLQTLLVLVCSGTAGCSAGIGSEQVLRSCVGADATPPEKAIVAPTKATWDLTITDLPTRAASDWIVPFEITPSTCSEGRWFSYFPLGSAGADVHRASDGECEVWLRGETEDPGYGGPFAIDGPYCVSPGVSPDQPCGVERRPDECFRSWTARVGDWIRHQANELASARWISVQTSGGEVYQIGVIAPGFARSAAIGDELAIDLRSQMYAFAPAQSNLEIRGPDDGLVYWLGIAGGLAGLAAPEEIALADAGVECEQASDCIEGWELHRVRANIGGGTATLAYGASANIGPFRFVHAGLDVQTGVSRCSDAFAAFSGASAWPTLQAEN
jgi:hypothetical protein